MKTNIKVIATSLSLATSVSAVAGIGGLSVQSYLGQPFSGSIVVSGDEARALIASGSVNVSGSGIRGSMIKQSEDRVLVRLRSSSPVREPVITFTVSAGRQTREYTAFLDPVRYTPKEAPIRQERNISNANSQDVEVVRPEKKQRIKQRDFIERKKPMVEEERRPARSVETAETSSEEMTTVKKTAKVSVSPRRHRARAGEHLANIAERYRPRGMSQQAAMRALMLANPSAFKHGATIRRNVVLYVPTESQWYAYAERAQKQVMKERVKQVRRGGGTRLPEVDMTVNDVAPPVAPPVKVEPPKVKPQTTPTVQAAEPKTTETKPTPKSVESQPSENKNAASQPKKVESVKASESVQAGTKPASTVEEKSSSQPTQPENASKINSASVPQPTVPMTASGASAVEQPRPPVQRPPMVEEPVEPIEEETDYLTLGLGGLAGAAVLGGIGYAAVAMRRRRNTAEPKESEWETEDNTSNQNDEDDVWGGDVDFGANAKPTYTTNTSTSSDEYFNDDEFSLDKISPAPAASANSRDEFSLDNFEPNHFDTFSNSSAAPSGNHQHQNDDWAWIEGEAVAAPSNTLSDDNFVVAEEDEWSLDKLDAISESNKKTEQTFSLDDFVVDDIQPATAASTVSATAQPADDLFDLSDFDAPTQPETSATSANVGDDVLDLDFAAFNQPAATPFAETATEAKNNDDLAFDSFDDFIVAEPVAASPTEIQPASDDGLLGLQSLDDFVVAEKPAEIPVAPVQAASDDDLAFGLDAFDDFVVPTETVAETPAAPVQAASDDDLAFGLDAFEDFVVPTETVAETPAAAVQAASDDDLAFGLDAFDDFVVPTETVAEIPAAPVQAASDDDLAFGLDAFEDFVVPTETVAEIPAAPVQAAADDDLSFGLDAFEDFVVPTETVAEIPAAAVQAASDDDLAFGLDAFADFAQTETVTETTVTTTVQTASDDDLAFGLDAFEDFVVPTETVAETPAAPVQAASDDDLAFGLDAFADFVVPTETTTAPTNDLVDLTASFDDGITTIVPEPEIAPIAPAADDNLAFGLDAFADFAPIDEANSVTSPSLDASITDVGSLDLAGDFAATLPEIAETPISLDVPAVAEPAISLDMPVQQDTFDNLSFDIDLDNSLVAESPQVSAPVGMLDLTTGPLDMSSTLDVVNLDTLESIDDLQGWEDKGSQGVGFVSGAVSDMTEPLEAKFELAKMYLEIDDAVAARETLRQLISESTGSIQEQAKQLLADLGN